jgi:hypothetical protein
MPVRVRARVHLRVHVCLCACSCECACVRMRVRACVHVPVCVSVHVHVHVHGVLAVLEKHRFRPTKYRIRNFVFGSEDLFPDPKFYFRIRILSDQTI